MKISSTYDKYKIFVIISTIITIFIAVLCDKPETYKGMELIPLIYILFFILNKPLHNYCKTHNGLLLLNVLMYIKYVLSILIIGISKDYTGPSFYMISASENSYHMAIIYMIAELISIHLVILFFSKHFYRKYGNG